MPAVGDVLFLIQLFDRRGDYVKKIQILLVVIPAMFLATPALAQVGGYVGAGFLSANTNNANDFAPVNGPGSRGDQTATGLKVYGGYMFRPYLGVEAGYYDLGTYDVKDGTGVKTDDFKTSAFAVSAVGSWPFGTGFNVHGKLGLAFTTVDYTCKVSCAFPFVNTSKSDVSPLLGIGVGWKATRNFSVVADLELFSQVNHAVSNVESKADYTVLSISGQYNF